MKLFKKFIGAALACAAVLVLLTACGSTGGGSSNTTNDTTAAINAALKSSGSKVVLAADDNLAKDAKDLADAYVADYRNGHSGNEYKTVATRIIKEGKKIIVFESGDSAQAIADAIVQQEISATKIGSATLTVSDKLDFDYESAGSLPYIGVDYGTIIVLE